jgi:methylated-DNA-[protein]-cysteine S-methyltransferase
VIGANGALTGFAGGLNRKRWLLDHEAAIPAGQAVGMAARQSA